MNEELILTQEQIQEQYEDLQQLLKIMGKWKVESVKFIPQTDNVEMVFKETSPMASTFGLSTFFGVHSNE